VLAGVVYLLLHVFNKRIAFGRILAVVCLTACFAIIVAIIADKIFSPKILSKRDYYGTYKVDKSYFDKKQAAWQHEHFTIKITEPDNFELLDNDSLPKTFKGKINFLSDYESAEINYKVDSNCHHILSSPPIIVRHAFSFHVVLHSTKFSNMYFIKQ
jgi:hypothetical protein